MVNYTFSKSLRLLDAKAYKAVFEGAKLKVSSSQVLYLARPNSSTTARVGLVIAKKNVRHATQRNRIKRIIRESFRLKQHQLAGIDTVVLARKGLDSLDNSQLHALFDKLWQQLLHKAENKRRQHKPKTDA